MDNPTFVDEETIPMINQDEDYYDDYRTPDTSRVDETSFTEPATTEPTSTLRLRQKVKRDRLTALYRHLNMTGYIDLINLGRFRLTTNPKKGATIFEYFNLTILTIVLAVTGDVGGGGTQGSAPRDEGIWKK